MNYSSTWQNRSRSWTDAASIFWEDRGAWEVASRFPSRFAAVAAFAGPKDPYRARDLKFVPLWAFEGEAYGLAAECSVVLGPEGTSSRKAIMALRTCGGEKARLYMFERQSG